MSRLFHSDDLAEFVHCLRRKLAMRKDELANAILAGTPNFESYMELLGRHRGIAEAEIYIDYAIDDITKDTND